MKKLSAVILASVALALISAPGASAATEFGSSCTASAASGANWLLQTGKTPGDPLPHTAPTSGVVTRWKINLIPTPSSIPQQLVIARATAAPNQFQVTGVSGTGNVTGGTNSFETRLPVQAGDQIGLYGNSVTGTLYCPTANETDKVAAFAGAPPSSGPATAVSETNKILLPATAVIEPDADSDGYGDETQDKCPQSAAFQTECPTLSLEALAVAGRQSATTLVAATSKAPVSVTGTVTIPKIGKKARRTVQLSAPTQTVEAGRIGRFELLFPGALQGALKALSSKRFLILTVTASGTDLIGRTTTISSVVQLKGQAKPKRKKAGGSK